MSFLPLLTAVSVISSPTDSQLFIINEQISFTFTCTATGFPSPTLSFQRGSDPLNRTEGEGNIGDTIADRVKVGIKVVSAMLDDTVTQNLTLFAARDEDTGSFSCTSSTNIPGNGMQTDMVSFNLTVLGEECEPQH